MSIWIANKCDKFHNFTQKDLTEVSIYVKVSGGATFLKHPVDPLCVKF